MSLRNYEKVIVEQRICKGCGEEFSVNKARIYKHKSGRDKLEYCSRKCSYEHMHEWSEKVKPLSERKIKCSPIYPGKCEICGKLFITNQKIKKTCSKVCNRRRLANKQIERDKLSFIGHKYICKWCDKEFITEYGIPKKSYCSNTCAKLSERWNNHHRRTKRFQNRRYEKRLSENNMMTGSIKTKKKELLIKIYFRDHGLCQLCKGKINLKHKVPNLLAGTLDHIVPLSKGGLHDEVNIQLSHFRCNSIKRDNIFGQMRLFG